ncbi:phenylalanine--tRNA ligase subunit alpha [Myxococcota bacterium]|nr:phenylalanine--tRNA ligase subunit alpha [Myxococcota bacterium]MBU1431780.1 phenylalanine--tRNA ligase subunit alpha [Myxococcota bacterium]MBU1898479.1 phenylalanine--tRNA ligase subunit alpha [Myxococcota bacterium]
MSDPLQGLREGLAAIQARAAEIAAAVTREADLPEARAEFFGRKKGAFNPIMSELGKLSREARPEAGQLINDSKLAVEALFEAAKARLEAEALDAAIEAGRLDVTLPGRRVARGAIHPIQRVMDELIDLFGQMGFDLAEGPEVETEAYNFDLLNMPADHPARDMQDTFYLSGGLLLRTQTSPMQIRAMEAQQPPIRIIAPGKVFRADSDPTHSPTFHQIEGLWIDEDVTIVHLKAVLTDFLHRLFGPDKKVRFRPSFFPFTEPSVEVDIWDESGAEGKWMEVLGAGMVHPQVLRNVGWDPNKVQGFAFGLGVDRLAMTRYGITHIAHLFTNDQRFLSQF